MKNLYVMLICFWGNCMMAQTYKRYDVVISEIFPDPSPAVGLPASEYLELTNASGRSVNLDKWRITDGNSTAYLNGGFILQPDSQVIICSRAYVSAFSVFGATIGVSAFPSLDNTGDIIILLSPEGRTIHAVSYSIDWYGNPLKQEGGWSLEMIDIHNPCRGADNWQASISDKGGTPGKLNSVSKSNPDTKVPKLICTYTIDSLTIAAVFNESMDSNFSAIPTRYQLDHGIGTPVSAVPVAPAFNEVYLHLPKPMLSSLVYQLQINEATDCAGNTGSILPAVKAGLPVFPQKDQIRINEILFNPGPKGTDYVELYNRGSSIVDLHDIYLGNKQNGSTGSLKRCSEVPLLFFPGEYIALSENSDIVFREYRVMKREQLVTLQGMPSFPDNEGTVVLLDGQGRELDLFTYRDDYHFPLLSNPEGVALERIDPALPAQDPANWHSAATDAGYGTPGYINSQYKPTDPVKGEVYISPLTFSPDNDGYDDQLTVQYRFPSPGYTCSVIIFDQAGRPVRYLTRNNLCGTNGYFRWNGLDEKTNILPAGIYYLVAEIFNLDGKRKVFKKGIVLAYKMH